MSINDQIHSLGWRGVSSRLSDVIAQATEKRWSPMQLVERMVQLEQDDRAQRGLERRVTRSRIGSFKSMEDFDWSWPSRIDRSRVEECLRLDFLKEQKNVVLVAAQGLGKTMIAKNVAHQAVQAGQSVIFASASQVLLDLAGQESARALDRRLRHYANVNLLVLDELGYLSYDARNADLLFQLVNRRYDRRSLVITTNLGFSEWPTVFPNATSATALIDRLIHHAVILTIDGTSFRRREAEAEAEVARPTAVKAPPPAGRPKSRGRG